jgi:hypothetical protein
VAQINIVGTYTSANFSAGADNQGNVKIFDPVVPNGGSVEPFPQQGVDLPNIAFRVQTTLAYAENAASTGGTLTVTDGRHAAAIALLGNYMAGNCAVADDHGGTPTPPENDKESDQSATRSPLIFDVFKQEDNQRWLFAREE